MGKINEYKTILFDEISSYYCATIIYHGEEYKLGFCVNTSGYFLLRKLIQKRACVAGMQYVEYKYKIRNNGNIYFYHNPRTIDFNNKDENYIDNWYNREEKIIYTVPQYLWVKMLAISNGL